MQHFIWETSSGKTTQSHWDSACFARLFSWFGCSFSWIALKLQGYFDKYINNVNVSRDWFYFTVINLKLLPFILTESEGASFKWGKSSEKRDQSIGKKYRFEVKGRGQGFLCIQSRISWYFGSRNEHKIKQMLVFWWANLQISAMMCDVATRITCQTWAQRLRKVITYF